MVLYRIIQLVNDIAHDSIPRSAGAQNVPFEPAARAHHCSGRDGIGIATFWLLFVTIGMAPASPPACCFAYEHAFPPPDLLLAAALIASGIDILRGGEWGMNVSLACAGGLMFLGVLDLSFSAQNGGFAGPLSEALQAGVISLWCIGLGLAIIVLRAAPRRAGAGGVSSQRQT
jgi:hypothetical protein